MAASTVTKPETPGHSHDPAAVAVYGTELRGAKQGDGKERRVEIAYNDPIPYRWICKIKIFNEVANELVELPESCPCKDCKAEENQLSKCKYTPKSTSAPAYGTGFLVNIPQSTRCILFTAAHNLAFKAKDSAFMDPKDDKQDKDSEHHIVSVARIVVTFPGKEPIIIKKKHFFFPSRYTCRQIDDFARSNYDYGVVVLPGTRHPNQACGFGFTAAMTDRELLGGISLSIFGYPMLKDEEMKQSNAVLPPGKPPAPATSGTTSSDSKPNLNTRDDRELYGSGGNVQSVGPRMIRYFVNTSEGQSGCPVYLWDSGYYTVVGIHVRFERLGEYTINAASRIRVGMLQNILTWLHTYDVDIYRPKHTNDPTVPAEVATRTAEDFWYPFWHVGLSSETSNRILNISGPAPRDPSMVQTITYDALDPASEQQDQPFEELVAAFGQKNPGAQIGILPVKTFSEGQRVDFQDNLWVLSSIEYPDTFVTFDSFQDVYERRISASSRYRNTPILSKALELVKMFMLPQVEGDPTRDWQIIPLRCPNVIYQPDRMKSSAERRRFDAYFQGFDFQHVTITKMGDEAGAVVVAVPTARVKIAGMDELEEDLQDKEGDGVEGGEE